VCFFIEFCLPYGIRIFRSYKFLFPLFFFFVDIVVSFHRDAATVMLSGQIADGFTTIFAGELVYFLN
jgi:hypothetical protein